MSSVIPATQQECPSALRLTCKHVSKPASNLAGMHSCRPVVRPADRQACLLECFLSCAEAVRRVSVSRGSSCLKYGTEVGHDPRTGKQGRIDGRRKCFWLLGNRAGNYWVMGQERYWDLGQEVPGIRAENPWDSGQETTGNQGRIEAAITG